MSGIGPVSQRYADSLDRLLRIWESSVRQTHTFLTEEDVLALRPGVERALAGIESLRCFCDETDRMRGFLDVRGVGFYRHMGFAVQGRSERDGQGRPFPLLHMKWSGAHG